METTRILVVDDDDDIRKLMASLLRDWGYEHDLADGVESALECVHEKEYTIVITDKNMPFRDSHQTGGLYLVEYIKKNYPSTEVLMMTGFASVESAVHAMKAGAFDYLTKPFSKKELSEKISRILDYRKFINPRNAIPVYKEIHASVLELLESLEHQTPEEKHSLLKKLDKKIDHFFNIQKNCETFLIIQHEALSKIAGYAEQLLEFSEMDEAAVKLIEKIVEESGKRL